MSKSNHDDPLLERRFPVTRRSAVLDAASTDAVARARALEVLVRAYWKPVYTHIRLRWHLDSDLAQELVQEYFARALEKSYFAKYDPSQAKFRTYVRMTLDRFVSESQRNAGRLKRGGGTFALSLDFEGAEGEISGFDLADPESVDAAFDTAWARHLITLGLENLRTLCEEKGKQVHFAIFEAYALGDGPKPTYQALAEKHQTTTPQVTNYLNWCRSTLRNLVLEELRAITTTDDEFRNEARAVLGVDL